MRLIGCLTGQILLSFSLQCGAQKPATVGNPNIVIIIADDLGWNDISLHGSEIQTPNIDALFRSGMVLNRFYVAPICSPTRAGLLTGKYPNRFGLRDYVISPVVQYGMPQEEITIPEVLSAIGYKNRGAFGKWHLGHSSKKYLPRSQGFSYFYGHYNGAIDYYSHKRSYELDWHRNEEPCFDKGYSTDLLGNDVIRFIGESSKDNTPFFAYVAFNAPHAPMQAKHEHLLQYGYDPQKPMLQLGGDPSKRGYNEADPDYGVEGKGNTVRQTYAAMVASLDENVGKIVGYLEANGLRNNTLIWFMSDNGGEWKMGGNNEPLRGQKYSEWEGGVRVVSAVSWPAKVASGTASDEVMAYIDVLPTIAAITNANDTAFRDGVNVWPAMAGSPLQQRTIYLGGNAVVNKEWKLNEGELFRIDKDPNEKNNLALQEQDQLQKLKKMLENFQKINMKIPAGKRPAEWKAPKNWTIVD